MGIGVDIPTEPIGNIPRPACLLKTIAALGTGRVQRRAAQVAQSPDLPRRSAGEYCPDGFRIPFKAGHTRRMRRLTAKPYRYDRSADQHPGQAMRGTRAGNP